jgi:hypothetical protein
MAAKYDSRYFLSKSKNENARSSRDRLILSLYRLSATVSGIARAQMQSRFQSGKISGTETECNEFETRGIPAGKKAALAPRQSNAGKWVCEARAW